MSANPGALARRWFDEVWNNRKAESVDALLATNALAHTEGGDLRGPGAFKEMRAQLLGAFPDIHVTVEAVVAQGDDAVVRWSATATHTGHDLGFPASGRAVRFRGMSWMRFEGGTIVEGWDSWNLNALMETCRTAEPKVSSGAA